MYTPELDLDCPVFPSVLGQRNSRWSWKSPKSRRDTASAGPTVTEPSVCTAQWLVLPSRCAQLSQELPLKSTTVLSSLGGGVPADSMHTRTAGRHARNFIVHLLCRIASLPPEPGAQERLDALDGHLLLPGALEILDDHHPRGQFLPQDHGEPRPGPGRVAQRLADAPRARSHVQPGAAQPHQERPEALLGLAAAGHDEDDVGPGHEGVGCGE